MTKVSSANGSIDAWKLWWAHQYGPPGTYFGLGEPTSAAYDSAKAFAVALSRELGKEKDYLLYLDTNRRYVPGSLWYMDSTRFVNLIERTIAGMTYRDEQLYPLRASAQKVVLGVLARYERCGGTLVEALELLEKLRTQ